MKKSIVFLNCYIVFKKDKFLAETPTFRKKVSNVFDS